MLNRIILLVGLILVQTSLFSQNRTLSASLQREVEKLTQQARENESNGNINTAIGLYTKAAKVYWVNGVSDRAMKAFEKAAELSRSIGNSNAQKVLYTNIAMICIDEENYSKALDYLNRCLSINRKQNRKSEIAATLINLSNVYKELNKLADALKSAEEANRLAQEINHVKLLRNSYAILSEIHEELGNTEKSSQYFSLYSAFTRKIQREEQRKKEIEAKKKVKNAREKLAEITKQKEYTEQELQTKQKMLETVADSLQRIEKLTKEQQMQIDLLNKEKALKDATIRNQILIRNIFIVIILSTLGIAGLIAYHYIQKKRSNEILAEQKQMVEAKSLELMDALKQIEKQNKDIRSSINYAQRIQQALLPTYDTLVTAINDAFILFRPRNIVSGDFYWFAGYAQNQLGKSEAERHHIVIPNIKQNGFIIAAVDCTGHGIPGAFMSMIGLNLIDTLVRSGVVQPDILLNHLHKLVRYLLKQENNDSRDGMDMAVCNISEDGRTVQYAGAKNPVYFIRDGELNVIKGDPVPVGGLQKEKQRTYTLHTINITSPTSFYIFSDGFIDQFGGENGSKFSSKRFKELLLRNHHLPMIMQQEVMETTLEEWMGTENTQIDDILVVGFKLTGGQLYPKQA